MYRTRSVASASLESRIFNAIPYAGTATNGSATDPNRHANRLADQACQAQTEHDRICLDSRMLCVVVGCNTSLPPIILDSFLVEKMDMDRSSVVP